MCRNLIIRKTTEKINKDFRLSVYIFDSLDYLSRWVVLLEVVKSLTLKPLTLSTVKIPSSIWTLLIGIILTLASLWYGQNHGLLPDSASNEADLVDGLFNSMMTVSTGIFLLVEGIIIFCAIRYRRRPGDNEDGPPVHGNVPLEILWTAIPAVIVLGISVYSFDVYQQIGGIGPRNENSSPIAAQTKSAPGTAIAATLSDGPVLLASESQSEANNPAGIKADQNSEMVVNVTGLQYAFIFTYPDTGVVSGELHVPAGRQVKVNMNANDVIHAFWVPEFRLKQDLIPGRQTELSFTPNKLGNYPVVCAELCGPYHGAMRTQVVVHTPEDFDNWMQQQQVASAQQIEQAIAVAPYTDSLGISGQVIPDDMHAAHHHHQEQS